MRGVWGVCAPAQGRRLLPPAKPQVPGGLAPRPGSTQHPTALWGNRLTPLCLRLSLETQEMMVLPSQAVKTECPHMTSVEGCLVCPTRPMLALRFVFFFSCPEIYQINVKQILVSRGYLKKRGLRR